MASKSYFLLINNIVAKDELGNPIFEVYERGVRMFKNSKTDEDMEERVDQLIAMALERDAENPINAEVTSDEVITRYSQELKLKMIITPLYDLLTQLAVNKKVKRKSGSVVDLRVLWDEQKPSFFVLEFLKYYQIMTILEAIVKKNRRVNTPLTIRNGKHRIMALLYLKINGLFNPLETMEGFENTHLLQEILTGKEAPIESLDSPLVFKIDIIQGKIPCYLATSSDILALCGVNHKESLSSANLYRLIAGIMLRETFSEEQLLAADANIILSFPVNLALYEVYDDINNEVISYFGSRESALDYSEGTGYMVTRLETNTLFINSSFPSFQKRPVAQNNPLIDKIEGATFVR